MLVGPRYAFGSGKKGLALFSSNRDRTKAYVDHRQSPVEDCWVRLAIRPETAEREGAAINLARIRAGAAGLSEDLVWRTGEGITSTSLSAKLPIAGGTWSQVQLGVLADGTVELWGFDGRQEFLVNRGVNLGLAGRAKNIVSLGNDRQGADTTFEVWLDRFAVAEQRLPWRAGGTGQDMLRPAHLEPDSLPPRFSFVFGSDIRPSLAPYRNTALDAAATMEPDFFLNLGDYGYPDSEAYTQSKQGYLALWNDLVYEGQMSRLHKKPWIYVASDHDMGNDDVDAASLSPFALEAFDQWQNNDRTTDSLGRYGSIEFDGGRVLLVWIDTITFRSPIGMRDGSTKTMLGAEQKRWLLNLLASSPAPLIMIASQTTVSHKLPSSWMDYPTERREIVFASRASKAAVRWLTGDHHAARWANFGRRVVEWGAAPLGDTAHEWLAPDESMERAICIGAHAREALSRFRENTSFGRVAVDTEAKMATFEIRDARGLVRVDGSGFPMTETVTYG